MSDPIVHVVERLDAAQMRRGEVVDITESGTVIVALDGVDATLVRCDLLVTTEAPAPVMVAGDQVLTWSPSDGASAVVLGRIGPSRGLTPDAMPDELPDTITLEAKHSLVLRVGDGSITIRDDGKILVKGKDLVSHAQRMNRIKGGAVSIN
jgi:hypothetical protein